jgi:hypothetical protein
MVERLRRSGDDQIVDMMRSLALRDACHVVTVSLGEVSPEDRLAIKFRTHLPEPFASRFATMLDAVERMDDLEDAEKAFEAVADAVAVFAGTVGTGVQAMLVRRDGTVELAMPNSGVQTIRSTPFPGFAEEAA